MKTRNLRTIKNERSLIKVKKETFLAKEGFFLTIYLENKISKTDLRI